MLQSIEGIIDHNGTLHLLDKINLPKSRRVIITILNEEAEEPLNLALMSELALAQDWYKPEDEVAWQHLAQPS